MVDGYYPRLFYFNRSAPGANTDIIANGITNILNGATTATSYTPSVDCYIAVSIVVATASVVNMTETYSGTTFTYGLERSATVSSGDLFGWSLIPVFTACTYNFQVETDSIIRRLAIVELQSGVAS